MLDSTLRYRDELAQSGDMVAFDIAPVVDLFPYRQARA
jgi:hypothetical protein